MQECKILYNYRAKDPYQKLYNFAITDPSMKSAL